MWISCLLFLLIPPSPMDNGQEAREAWKRAMKAHEGVPWKERYILESKRRIALHCNTDLETAERYLQAIDRIDVEMERFFLRLFGELDSPPGMTIYIYGCQEEFMEMEDEKGDIGAVSHPLDGSIRTYHGRTSFRRGTLEALGREIARRWEATLVRDRMNIPPWLYRGLPICIGEAVRIPRGGRAKILRVPRDRLADARWYSGPWYRVSIQEILRLPRSQYTRRHDSQAWSLVHFFLHGTGPTGPRFIRDILEDCVDRSLTPEEVEERLKVFGTPAQVEEAWRRFTRGLDPPPHGEILPGNRTFRSDYCNASITLPHKSWRWDFEKNDWTTQVALRKREAVIELRAYSNRATERPDALVTRVQEDYEVIRIGCLRVNGYLPGEMVYQDRPNVTPLRRTRRVCVTTVPHVIYIELSAPVAVFEECEEDFEKVVQSLQLHFDKPG